ncbi:MAG: DUF4325 domain-containing protein [Candidatus Moraniibacteriota bacterium]
MHIMLKKFGETLLSRQAGKEAYGAFHPVLREVKPNDTITIDFEGVATFSPSWGDEFFSSLFIDFKNPVEFIHATENPSVRLTLQLLEKIREEKFTIKS